MRDLFETELSGFEIAQELNPPKRTYRNLLDEYLQGLDWTDFGIDIIIGSVADEEADYRAQTFLPDYLHDWADRVNYQSKDGLKPLVSSEHKVLALDLKQHRSYLMTPFVLFSILAFIELLLFLFKSRSNNKSTFIKWYDVIGYFSISVCSLVVLFMWFLTDHQACGANYNVMWANPLFLLVLVGQFWEKVRDKALFISTVFLVITMLFWVLIPQQYHTAFIPIIVLFVFKNLRQMRLNHSQKRLV